MARFKTTEPDPIDDPEVTIHSRENVEGYHKQLRHKTWRKRGLVFAVVLAVVGVLAIAGYAAARIWLDDVEQRMNDNQVVDVELIEALADPVEPGDTYYMLLLGTDGRPGETVYRSDTIILTRVDPTEKTVTMLSIPRDTRVQYRGSWMKLTEVHAYGGAAGMVEVVSGLCDVDISHYAEVNFDGLAGIADALGGVTVDVDVDMFDNKNFSVVTSLSKGVHTLDGEEALFYCRCRAFPDGDFTRMRHQRTFIKACINQVMNSLDPTSIVGLVDACADMVITDLSVSDILSMANEMRGIDTENGIYSAQVPGYATMINEISYVIVSDADFARYMEVIDAGGDPSTLDETATYDSSIDYGSSSSSSTDSQTTYEAPTYTYEPTYTYTEPSYDYSYGEATEDTGNGYTGEGYYTPEAGEGGTDSGTDAGGTDGTGDGGTTTTDPAPDPAPVDNPAPEANSGDAVADSEGN